MRLAYSLLGRLVGSHWNFSAVQFGSFSVFDVRFGNSCYWDDISADQLIDPEEMTEWREKLVSTRATFSNLGARLGAFDQGEPFASWVVMKMGFNLPKAAGNLRNLGIGFGARMEDPEEIFKKMDAALKFRINPKQRNFYNPHNVGR